MQSPPGRGDTQKRRKKRFVYHYWRTIVGTDGGLRPLFRKCLPQFFWTSIETGDTTSGVPDCHYILRGQSGFIEYKQTNASIIKSLDKFQVAWIHRYARYGGRSWIACRRRHDGGPRRGPPIDELWLVPGLYAQDLRSGGLLGLPSRDFEPVNDVHHWEGGPARWDWDAVAACLLLPVAFSPAALADQRAGEQGTGRGGRRA